MWEFYLASCELRFRYLGLNNLHIQVTRNQYALLLTRDYIAREEARLRKIEAKVHNKRRQSSRVNKPGNTGCEGIFRRITALSTG